MTTSQMIKQYAALKRTIELKSQEADHWRDRIARRLLANGSIHDNCRYVKVRETKVSAHNRKGFHYIRLSKP